MEINKNLITEKNLKEKYPLVIVLFKMIIF